MRQDKEALKLEKRAQQIIEFEQGEYTEAKEAMFFYTDAAGAPWTVVRSNGARLNCMKHFLSSLEYPDKDRSVATSPGPLIVHTADDVVHSAAHVLKGAWLPFAPLKMKDEKMTHTPHELAEEFPEFTDQISALRQSDSHFAKLADRYHMVNRNVHRAESDVEPTSDDNMVMMRKERMVLKDEIFAYLTT